LSRPPHEGEPERRQAEIACDGHRLGRPSREAVLVDTDHEIGVGARTVCVERRRQRSQQQNNCLPHRSPRSPGPDRADGNSAHPVCCARQFMPRSDRFA
jgi:hypothetical protein